MSAAAKPYDALALGEVMLRLSPEGEERIAQSGRFVKHAGGSELNVMGGIAGLGLRAGLISRLPDSPVGRYVRGRIRAGLPYQQCVACGNVAAALKNTIPGDLLNTAPAELRQIIADHQSGSASEMER